MAMVSWEILDGTPEECDRNRRNVERVLEEIIFQTYGERRTVTLLRPKHPIIKKGTIFVDVGKSRTIWKEPNKSSSPSSPPEPSQQS